MSADPDPASGSEFLESLQDTSLYTMGAFFCDSHPELIDDVIAQSEDIEGRGLEAYAEAEGLELEQVFQTLVTGLAVRYYKAVAG
jgi:hypothetical protein